MITTRRLLPSAAAVALLALAGCSAGDSPVESPSPSAATSETGATDTPTEPEASETTETEASETTEPAAGAGDAACLDGSWTYSAAEVEKTFAEMMSNVGSSPVNDLTVTGDAVMTFDGSTITQVYDPQVWTIKAGPETMNMEMVLTMAGSTVGQYTVEGDLIRVTEIDVTDYDVTTEVLVDGKPMDGLGDLGLDNLVGETGSGLPEGQVRFACAGDELSLTAIVPDQPDFSFSYTLTRR